MEYLLTEYNDIKQNIDHNLNKKDSAYWDLVKFLQNMKPGKHKDELTKLIYNYSKLNLEYISTLEMHVARLSLIYNKMKERHDLDQALFEHLLK